MFIIITFLGFLLVKLIAPIFEILLGIVSLLLLTLIYFRLFGFDDRKAGIDKMD